MTSGIRAFIAVELSVEIKAELTRIQTVLKRDASCPIRWVTSDSTHLTLCFLGELNQGQIEAVKAVMGRIGGSFSPLQLRLSALGVFPQAAQMRTIWVGLDGERNILSGIHRHLEEGLSVMGYQPELRPFRPHLTLARVPSEASPTSCIELGAAMRRINVTPLVVGITELSLMKSTLSPTGAIYTRLYRVGLTGVVPNA